MDQTFTLLPLYMDPSSKAISSPSLPTDPALTTALSNLNTLHRTLLTLPNAIPPPPLPANPKRSAQIQKMREQANTTMKKAANNPSQAQGTSVAPLSISILHHSRGKS
jgi:translocation protein SEC72